MTSGGAARLMLGTQELAASEDVFPVPRAVDLADRASLHRRRQDQAPHAVAAAAAARLRVRAAIAFTRDAHRDARELHAQEARLQRDHARNPCSASCIRARRATASASCLRRLGDLWVMPIGGKPERLTNDAAVETDAVVVARRYASSCSRPIAPAAATWTSVRARSRRPDRIAV